MAKHKRRPEKCYMCDGSGITKEHVPPYSFFPEGFRTNLITVPSCPKHNNNNSKDVEYVRNIIVSAINVNETAQAHFPAVLRSFLRSPKLAGQTFNKVTSLMLPDGETAAFEIDLNRFRNVMQSIAYALYYRDFGPIYPHEWKVYCSIMRSADYELLGIPAPQNRLIRDALTRLAFIDKETSQPDVFRYGWIQESEYKIAYRFVFYGGVFVYAIS